MPAVTPSPLSTWENVDRKWSRTGIASDSFPSEDSFDTFCTTATDKPRATTEAPTRNKALLFEAGGCIGILFLDKSSQTVLKRVVGFVERNDFTPTAYVWDSGARTMQGHRFAVLKIICMFDNSMVCICSRAWLCSFIACTQQYTTNQQRVRVIDNNGIQQRTFCI